MQTLNIPVGISDFAEIRRRGYYYVDKSALIRELLARTGAEVTLITRPRRFGKTLAMSMLENFFDIRRDSRALFEDLEIAKDRELCEAWMNRYPTIFVSFRQVDGLNFTGAYDMLTMVIASLFNRHRYLLEEDNVSEFQKASFRRLANAAASEKEVKNSLLLLTEMLQAHYGKPVILLIDEYDVPVAKANSNGYYREMLDVMRGLLQALKDNPALRLAVITGCLKIAKESIFTGTNNFVSDTVNSTRLNECFGFVQTEVDQLLAAAGCTDQAETIRSWYDGYHFGDIDVYCPWDVMNYLLELQRDPAAKPVSYWRNTSDNAIIREMNSLLRRTISYHDYREDFYHAFLAGIFTGAGYTVDSNKENGEGRNDVVVHDPVNGRVAIFEAKYTRDLQQLEKSCTAALQQIRDRGYAEAYCEDYDQILCYGIAFFKKRCLVEKF